jgi:SRSO17 transposase
MNAQDPSSFPSAEELWTAHFQEVWDRIGPCFARSETRSRAQAYLRGLLSPLERKNGWPLAEEAGESTPYSMQYLLDRAVWDAEPLRDVVREDGRQTLGDANGMLVIDETGFREIWDQVGGGATTVQRHGRPHRKLSDWRLFDLH